MAKKFHWLKLKEDFFRNKKIKKLRRIAGGDTYTIIYLKMQLLSLINDGKLFYEGVEESFVDELALEIDEDTENVAVTVQYLMSNQLLVEVDESYTLPEVLSAIGTESSSAERVRKHRALKKNEEQKKLQCNTVVTNCNTEIELEIELEKSREEKIKEKPISDKEQIKNMIEAYTSNPDLLKELCDFYEMRLGMKPKPTPLAMKRILNELNKLTNNDDEKIEILNNSIMNGWKGVFALKKSSTKQQTQRLTAEDIYNIPF